MSRLTQSKRDEIVNAVIKESISDKLAKLKEERFKFADKIYDTFMTPEIKDYMSSAPNDKQFFEYGTGMCINSLTGRYNHLYLKNGKPFPCYMRSDLSDLFNDLDPDVRKGLCAEYKKLNDKEVKYSKARNDLAVKVRGVVNSVTTEKRLLEVWPEAIKYFNVTVVDTNLPAIAAEDLTKYIKTVKEI